MELIVTVVIMVLAAPVILAFVPISLISVVSSSGISTTSLSAKPNSDKNAQVPKFLHVTEYKDDNYEHILGFPDFANHVPSKLQEISAHVIAETIRNKKPIDAVSHPLQWQVSLRGFWCVDSYWLCS